MKRILLAILVFAASSATLALDHSHKAWEDLLKKHVRHVEGGNASKVAYAGLRATARS